MAQQFDHYTGSFYSIRTARKEHKCSICKDPIKPGDKYRDEVMPPWVLIKDDPEYPAHPFGEWYRSRYHMPACPATLRWAEELDKARSVSPVQRRDPALSHVSHNPNSYPERQRRGGGIDPLADYLHAKGEL